MDFVAIDFETANPERSSACSVGLAYVENSKIVSVEYHLIKPTPFEFSPFNVSIHGITEADVKNAPDFLELSRQLYPGMKGRPLVAHNAAFDMGVIRRALAAYSEPCGALSYLCTYKLSQSLLPDVKEHNLKYLCKYFEIELRHHYAKSDAVACAELLLKLSKVAQCSTFSALSDKINLHMGQLDNLNEHFYMQAPKKLEKNQLNLETELLSSLSFDVSNPFYGKKIAVKGSLNLFSYAFMQAVAEKCLANLSDVFYGTCDFIVFGRRTYNRYIKKEYGQKFEKADKLVEAGTLTVLSEEEWCEMLNIPVAQKQKRTKQRSTSVKDITPNKTNFDEAHPIFDKVCVFTGALEKIDRKDAMQLVVDLGGRIGSSVTNKTNILILGNNDDNASIKGGKSSKQKRAEELKINGNDIMILSEEDFLNLIDNQLWETFNKDKANHK